MMLALLGFPFWGGCTAFLLRTDRPRRMLLVACAAMHLFLTAAAWKVRLEPLFDGWLALDTLGLLFLTLTSLLFLAASIYAVGYLRRESHGRIEDFEEGGLFSNEPEAVFIGCLLFFLGTMTLVTLSQRFGLLWVAIEATTLSSAPLIYFHRHHRSLEAAWKYLLICSVGIALALLGSFFLVVSAQGTGGRTLIVRGYGPVCLAPQGPVAQGRVSPFTRRLRDEDGPGPDAYVAAGRALGGAFGRVGASFRRAP